MLRNRWPACSGIGGRNQSESVAGFVRNRRPESSGICTFSANTFFFDRLFSMVGLFDKHEKYNVRHKWRADETPEDIKSISVAINKDSSKPQDKARPSSCHCYATELFSNPVSELLTGMIRRSMSVQILRFIIRKSYSVCKFSQN